MLQTKEYYTGLGRRKQSIARVRLSHGTGKVRVNKRSFESYFPRETHRIRVVKPLELAKVLDRYDVYANIRGGGLSGQAGAMKLGIARALLKTDPNLRIPLKKEGFLTRDARAKERKKYGQKRARKRFQFSKR